MSDWIFNGLDKNKKPKFKRPTNESLEDVINYVDKRKAKYIPRKNKSISIYTRVNKYHYYYTTGRWGINLLNNNYRRSSSKKYYMSKGIKDFYNRFFKDKLNQEKEYDYIKKIGLRKYGYPRYEYDYIRTVIGENKSLALSFYLLYYREKNKHLPFIDRTKIEWIRDTEEYKTFDFKKTQQIAKELLTQKNNT